MLSSTWASQELEHKEITKAASSLSQCTTLAGDSSPGELSPEILTIKPDVENALEQPDCHAISIWTRKSIGVVIGGFLLAFLTAICSAVTYGFFLGYMGLDSYVMSSITQLMKLPQVLLLPFGFLTDCCPIRGNHRKPYFLLSWCLAGCALLAMSLRPLPAPFYCQNEDGSYNFLVPPCNPNIHTEKNWYVFWMFILTAGGHATKSSFRFFGFLSSSRTARTPKTSEASSWASQPVRVSCLSTRSVSRLNVEAKSRLCGPVFLVQGIEFFSCV